MSVPRGLLGIPDQMVTKIRYVENLGINVTGGSIGKYVFRMNDPSDPDYTSSGHQPLYYDQWSAMYSKFVVEKSYIKVDYSQMAESTDGPTLVGLLCESGGTTAADVNTLMEGNQGVSTQLTPTNGSKSHARLYQTYEPFRDTGLTSKDDTLAGPGPATQYFATVWVYDTQGNAAVIRCKVEVVYTVRWFRRIDATGS